MKHFISKSSFLMLFFSCSLLAEQRVYNVPMQDIAEIAEESAHIILFLSHVYGKNIGEFINSAAVSKRLVKQITRSHSTGSAQVIFEDKAKSSSATCVINGNFVNAIVAAGRNETEPELPEFSNFFLKIKATKETDSDNALVTFSVGQVNVPVEGFHKHLQDVELSAKKAALSE